MSVSYEIGDSKFISLGDKLQKNVEELKLKSSVEVKLKI